MEAHLSLKVFNGYRHIMYVVYIRGLSWGLTELLTIDS